MRGTFFKDRSSIGPRKRGIPIVSALCILIISSSPEAAWASEKPVSAGKQEPSIVSGGQAISEEEGGDSLAEDKDMVEKAHRLIPELINSIQTSLDARDKLDETRRRLEKARERKDQETRDLIEKIKKQNETNKDVKFAKETIENLTGISNRLNKEIEQKIIEVRNIENQIRVSDPSTTYRYRGGRRGSVRSL